MHRNISREINKELNKIENNRWKRHMEYIMERGAVYKKEFQRSVRSKIKSTNYDHSLMRNESNNFDIG